MRVLLDEKPLTVSRPTLRAAIEEGRRAAERSGRVLVEATLDGEPIRDELLERPTEDDSTGAEVRFVSADPAALVSVTLRDVADALGDAKRDQDAAAELIQTGRVDEAMEHLSAVISAWNNAQQAVTNGTALLGINPDDVSTPEGDGLADCVRQLTERLVEMKRSMQAQDWASLADVLAYELDAQNERWRRLLMHIADRAPTGS